MGASGPSLRTQLGGAFGGGAVGAASSSLRLYRAPIRFWVDSLGKARVLSTIEPGLIKSPCSSIIFAAAARRCNSWACASEWHCGHTRCRARVHTSVLQFSINSRRVGGHEFSFVFSPEIGGGAGAGVFLSNGPRISSFTLAVSRQAMRMPTKRMIRAMIHGKDPAAQERRSQAYKNCQSQSRAETHRRFLWLRGRLRLGCWEIVLPLTAGACGCAGADDCGRACCT